MRRWRFGERGNHHVSVHHHAVREDHQGIRQHEFAVVLRASLIAQRIPARPFQLSRRSTMSLMPGCSVAGSSGVAGETGLGFGGGEYPRVDSGYTGPPPRFVGGGDQHRAIAASGQEPLDVTPRCGSVEHDEPGAAMGGQGSREAFCGILAVPEPDSGQFFGPSSHVRDDQRVIAAVDPADELIAVPCRWQKSAASADFP